MQSLDVCVSLPKAGRSWLLGGACKTMKIAFLYQNPCKSAPLNGLSHEAYLQLIFKFTQQMFFFFVYGDVNNT